MAQYTASENPLVLTVNENMVVRPIFSFSPPPTPTPTPVASQAAPTYRIVLTTNNPQGGTVRFTSPTSAAGLTVFESNVSQRLDFIAQENPGYEFQGWWLNNVLWSETNRTPAIFTNQSGTYEARFRQIPVEKKCTCYYIAPTDQAPTYDVRYRRCDTNELVTETFTTFRNICSANIPEAVRAGQVPISLGTDCTNNINICGSPPAPTPSATPVPSATPALTPTPTITPFGSPPAPSPTPSSTPAPTPTPSPGTWRSCIDGSLTVGNPPAGYRQGIYLGNDLGTVCYEPITTLGINPPLNNLVFDYQRGSSIIPPKKEIFIENPSYTASYNIKVIADQTLFVVEPAPMFVLAPRQKLSFRIGLNQNNISTFGDGQTVFDMKLETTELVR